MGDIYLNLDEIDSAVYYIDRLFTFSKLTNQPIDTTIFGFIAYTYLISGQEEKANLLATQCIDFMGTPNSWFHYCQVSIAYFALGKIAEMEKVIQESIQKSPNTPYVYFSAAVVYSVAKNKKKGLYYLEQMLKKGYSEFYLLCAWPDFKYLRQFKRYDKLMRKYFPEVMESIDRYKKNKMKRE